jgi:long-chain fatty acid transport protein
MRNRRFAVRSLFFALLCSLTLAPAAFATNGMNMEGYGPIATGMGGASMAYDNGTAATMNNPATLSLMESKARLDLALGFLGPDITTSMPGASADSSADLFIMPALGYARKSGDLVYGVGVFAQGGMGTEYAADSFLAFGSNDVVRSELGVGRFIIPFSYNVNKDFSIALSLDYVWATLDLKMALPGSQFGTLVTNCSGAVCTGLPGLGAAPWVRLDYSGGGDFNGAAKGTGFAGKIGAVYKISPEFTIGATYHSKTSLSDLETDSAGASLSVAGSGVIGSGKIKVRDFQWPETYAIGVAWNANKQLLVAADVKVIGWKSVMKDFKMTYEGPVAPAPGSNIIDFAMPQNWKDQTVFELGAAYLFTPEFTGRIGMNISDNPIPDEDMNYLFPAIIENHYTLGAGYAFSKASSIDFSFTYAPEVTQTAGNGMTTTHSQMNEQIMYSYRF